MTVNHHKGCIAFGGAGSLSELDLHNKSNPVLHEEMLHEAELGALAVTFAIELGVCE